jgi:hypothetical protein
MRSIAVFGVVTLACACGHSSQEPSAAPALSASPASSVAAVASAAPSASVAAAAATPQSWRGKYTTTPASLVVPKDWSKTHWSSADTTTGVGDGTLQLSVDPATHRVTGSLDGVVGAAVVEGFVGADGLTASVRRKDPTDKGLAGTLLAAIATDKVTGTLTLASGDGATLRSGTFTLTPDGH